VLCLQHVRQCRLRCLKVVGRPPPCPHLSLHSRYPVVIVVVHTHQGVQYGGSLQEAIKDVRRGCMDASNALDAISLVPAAT